MELLKIKIDPAEALRYAGHRSGSLPDGLKEQFEACYTQVSSLARPRMVAQVFSLKEHHPVRLSETNFVLPGAAIAEQLSGAYACVLMAVTIGSEVEQAIRNAQVKNLAKALFLDACASAAVESACAAAEEKLRAQLAGPPPFFTSRFSPGYRDLPLNLQRPFLQILDAGRKIGLFVSSSGLLTPRKSVTAVIGLCHERTAEQKSGCAACSKRETCAYRKGGITCEQDMGEK